MKQHEIDRDALSQADVVIPGHGTPTASCLLSAAVSLTEGELRELLRAEIQANAVRLSTHALSARQAALSKALAAGFAYCAVLENLAAQQARKGNEKAVELFERMLTSATRRLQVLLDEHRAEDALLARSCVVEDGPPGIRVAPGEWR